MTVFCLESDWLCGAATWWSSGLEYHTGGAFLQTEYLLFINQPKNKKLMWRLYENYVINITKTSKGIINNDIKKLMINYFLPPFVWIVIDWWCCPLSPSVNVQINCLVKILGRILATWLKLFSRPMWTRKVMLPIFLWWFRRSAGWK